MDPLTFAIGDEVISDDNLHLTPCSLCDISEVMWDELAAKIACERTLIPYPADVLARRCQEGYAATAICGEHIVSYISLVPIVEHVTGAHSWMAVTADLGLDPEALPSSDVYEFTSSWTDPAWRRRHISMALRPPLVERYLKSHVLGLSGMAGLASPVLARLGWQIIAWNTVPFVSSLIAAPLKDFPAQAAWGWRPPEGTKLYQGPHIPLDDPIHPWHQFCYCWVSNPAIAVDLEQELAALLHNDLNRWRSAVVAAFARPGSSHRLAFLT